MNSKAGTMSSGMAWLFAVGAVVLALGVDLLATKVSLPNSVTYLLYVAVIGGGAFCATYLTKAGTGMGILAFLVAGVLMAIGTYLIVSSVVASATNEATTALTAGATDPNAAKAAEGFGNAFGALAGILVAFVNFIVTIGAGITGASIGGRAKKKALAGGIGAAQPQRLAA